MVKTRKTDIDVVFVDLDGVIRHWPDCVGTLAARHGLEPGVLERLAFSPALLEPAIRGWTRDEDWRERIAIEAGKQYPDLDARQVVGEWSRSCGSLDWNVLKVLACCRAAARVILTTNATTRLETDLATLRIRHAFDKVVNSSDIGFIKPESAYYEHALTLAGTTADRALFVDDTPANVAAATDIGIRSHLFVDTDGLRAFLSMHGLGATAGQA